MIAFKNDINRNILLNCNITADNINIDGHIYGEATPILQGKIRIKKPTVHSEIEKIPLPLPISGRRKNLHLYMDF